MKRIVEELDKTALNIDNYKSGLYIINNTLHAVVFDTDTKIGLTYTTKPQPDKNIIYNIGNSKAYIQKYYDFLDPNVWTYNIKNIELKDLLTLDAKYRIIKAHWYFNRMSNSDSIRINFIKKQMFEKLIEKIIVIYIRW